MVRRVEVWGAHSPVPVGGGLGGSRPPCWVLGYLLGVRVGPRCSSIRASGPICLWGWSPLSRGPANFCLSGGRLLAGGFSSWPLSWLSLRVGARLPWGHAALGSSVACGVAGTLISWVLAWIQGQHSAFNLQLHPVQTLLNTHTHTYMLALLMHDNMIVFCHHHC